jgi:hypothetical protein
MPIVADFDPSSFDDETQFDEGTPFPFLERRNITIDANIAAGKNSPPESTQTWAAEIKVKIEAMKARLVENKTPPGKLLADAISRANRPAGEPEPAATTDADAATKKANLSMDDFFTVLNVPVEKNPSVVDTGRAESATAESALASSHPSLSGDDFDFLGSTTSTLGVEESEEPAAGGVGAMRIKSAAPTVAPPKHDTFLEQESAPVLPVPVPKKDVGEAVDKLKNFRVQSKAKKFSDTQTFLDEAGD